MSSVTPGSYVHVFALPSISVRVAWLDARPKWRHLTWDRCSFDVVLQPGRPTEAARRRVCKTTVAAAAARLPPDSLTAVLLIQAFRRPIELGSSRVERRTDRGGTPLGRTNNFIRFCINLYSPTVA